jgi:hypothetical protein
MQGLNDSRTFIAALKEITVGALGLGQSPGTRHPTLDRNDL